MLDTLIENATVYDGIRDEPQRLDVGIRGDTIAHVGEGLTAAARHTVDAAGLLLCPGFIDTHASTGFGYLLPEAGDNKLFQGVTTEIIGNCGTSPAPVGPLYAEPLRQQAEAAGFPCGWQTLGEWLARLEGYGLPFNIGTHIGHSTLRSGLVRDAQEVTETEVDTMAEWLDAAMADGALGLSTGLVYAPGSFATTEEIVRLARVVARRGGIYVSHMRDERQDLESSIKETVRIAREAALPVLVSHLKAAERPNWGKIPGVIETLEAARGEGLTINFEVYPYTAVSTRLSTFLPKPVMQDGAAGLPEKLRLPRWRRDSTDWLLGRGTDFAAMTLITESLPGVRGQSVAEIAAGHGAAPAEAVVDLLIADPEAWIVYDCISPDDMDRALLWPESIVCSDSWSYPVNAPRQIGNPHPRTFGAFTRFLERYALTGHLPFGHAVRKITSLPADWLRLPGRGRIVAGGCADLVLLDPSRLREKATFAEPRQLSEGTVGVWVGGTRMLAEGAIDRREMPGRVLRGYGRTGWDLEQNRV